MDPGHWIRAAFKIKGYYMFCIVKLEINEMCSNLVKWLQLKALIKPVIKVNTCLSSGKLITLKIGQVHTWMINNMNSVTAVTQILYIQKLFISENMDDKMQYLFTVQMR